jgi:hypothetical protein
MAERRTGRGLALAGAIACAAPCVAPAGDAAPARPRGFSDFMSDARALLQDSSSRIQTLLQDRFKSLSRDTPDWLLEQKHGSLADIDVPAADSLQLVVQQDRHDGIDLLTLRYPIATIGGLRTYAGAGLNQAEYYAADTGDAAPDLVARRNRHRSTGGAAELGAELRLTGQLLLNADVRWVELDPSASLLRANNGLVGADPVTVGVSLGWRFR